jgi:hypothetical protein
MLRGDPFLHIPETCCELFCLEDGDGRFFRNVVTFLSAYVQSPLRRQQPRRSVCMYVLRCNSTRHLTAFALPESCSRVFVSTVDTGPISLNILVPEEENRNVEKLQTHSDSLDWTRTHDPSMRVLPSGNLYTRFQAFAVF